MNIIFASENKEKLKGLKKIFNDQNTEILITNVRSNVGPAVNNDGLFIAVYNKINAVVDHLKEFDVSVDDWDSIITLKSGYCETIIPNTNGQRRYFITDVCAILDKNGYRVANGPMYEITKNIYDTALEDNKILERIKVLRKNDIENSIIDYISEGLVSRSYATRIAIEKALNSNYVDISNARLDYSSIISFENQNTKALDKKCLNEKMNYIDLEA